MWLGDIPPELQGLTIPEEKLISLYRHNSCVIKLHSPFHSATTAQAALKGNCITFLQSLPNIVNSLPLKLDDLCDTLKVIFVGAHPPERVHLKKAIMESIIKIKFNGKVKRFPYPATTIKEFIEVLRVEFNVKANTTLNLCDDGEELSTSSKLAELGIKDSSELILISSAENKSFTMKLQTLLGQVFEFRFNNDATLKDLYEAIYLKIEFTTTFLLLFNHRMHIFQSIKFLAEPIIHFLNLTTINEESIPHFYIFECDRTFETRKYEYTKNFRQIFLQSDLWQPRSGKQPDLAMSIYLNSMYALVRVFLANKDVDSDSVHNVYMPQFLIVLRRFLFPPACLAFKHAMEGALFNFEKQLLSEAFFHLFRNLLPKHISDCDLFSYTPYVFCWIFRNGDYSSTENACYESVELSRLNRPTNADAAKEGGPDKYFVQPVRLLNDKIVNGACNRFVLIEYEEVQTQYQLTEDDYQRQTDLVGLLMFLKIFEMPSNNNEPSQQRDLFEQYSSDYTLWVPNANVDLLSIGNVSEQKQNLRFFSDHDLHEIKQQLSTNDLFSIFTFADPLTLCKYNHAQFVLLKSGNTVYIKTAAKALEDSFGCLDPFDQNENFFKNDAASKEVLSQWPYLVIRENAADIRKIEQVTCIFFDISGSMNVMVSSGDSKHSLLELSTMAFGAWRDRLVSYRLPHSLGLIYFGADDELILGSSSDFSFRHRLLESLPNIPDKRVIVQCNITRDFTYFETALANQHDCGSDTPLYDAIDVAIQNIRSFRDKSKTRLSPTYRELILCLTDVADTCSKASQTVVLEKLLADNIVFDAISFDAVINNVLVEFCEKTKGYYYTDIQHDKEYMLNLFELEASISVQDREENIYGKIKYPQRRQSKFLDKPAIASKQARVSDGRATSVSLRRIMLEINNLNKLQLKNFDFFISKENIFFWKIIMHGETGTPYSDGRWLLFIEFPQIYPEQPPDIRFITKIYHCNVNDDGKICHDILGTAWAHKTSMYNVFMEILRLLREPNPDDALSSVKGAQCKESRDNYNNTIIEWKNLYANASEEELKIQYLLE
ncbi:unnamed protein product [Rotaria socialis]